MKCVVIHDEFVQLTGLAGSNSAALAITTAKPPLTIINADVVCAAPMPSERDQHIVRSGPCSIVFLRRRASGHVERYAAT